MPVASLRRPERLKQQTRKKRHQHWTEVMALHNKGCSFREISRITGLSRVTVSRWVRSGTFPEMSTRPPKRGLLDPWREWLKEQRESGNYNASRIWREMVAQGGGQAVKPSSGILLPNGVKAGTHRLLLPQDFLQCSG
ncbi:putative transposase [Escherichia coli O26:H11 str. CFSAN001629]|nr:putative transposase [Escherichia coli O26:H11 str. CFSAN001629]